ncbi:glycerophosphodiester phosphodiesterase family protein [Gammaproteobacteria bacterium]|nr:glycerophosphodiester phosphodiesterase family protein [Gammaproteobacteria bacterium]
MISPQAPCLNLGHRGARGLVFENTSASFATAMAAGCDGIEFDVQLTADNEVVVYHDLHLHAELTRDARGNWLEGAQPWISQLAFNRLQQDYRIGRIRGRYRARFRNQSAIADACIPSLQEFLSPVLAAGHDPLLLVEIKSNPEQWPTPIEPQRLADTVLDALQRLGVVQRSIIESFDWRVIFALREQLPPAQLGLLSIQIDGEDTIAARDIDGTVQASPWTGGLDIRDYQGDLPRMVADAGCQWWAPWHRDIKRQEVQQAHALGLRVATWTVNAPRDIRRARSLGVDAIISDYPDRVSAAFNG